MKTNNILIFAAFLFFAACMPKDPIEQKVNVLLGQMTLDEKIGQMNQLCGYGYSEERADEIRAGKIGSLINETDKNVVREYQRIALEESRLHIPLLYGRDVIHGYKTIFPIPLAQAATWNPALVEKSAHIAATEATTCGIRLVFSPMVDVSRDARWGRIAESFGEDTYLNSVFGAAMVRGYQTDDLSNPTAVAACVKHFAGYGASEGGRDYNTTWIPETQLRDTYLPPFKAAIDAGCAAVMCSFNDFAGVPSSGNRHLNVDILRNEWNYKGVLCSDWASIEQMVTYGYCVDRKEAALRAVEAQVDIDMEGHCYVPYIQQLVKEGNLSEKQIDVIVADILRLKYRLGLFDNPYPQTLDTTYYQTESLVTARQAAVESTILLKNDGILPLNENMRVAVVGPLADAPADQAGTWIFDGEPEHCVTPLVALQKVLGKDKLIYMPALTHSRDENRDKISATIAAAKKADVILCFLGEEALLSGESKCRAELGLPGAQHELFAAIQQTGKPVVLVVMAGRPLTIEKEINTANATLYQLHAGTMAGPALVDLLYGKVVPSGKLPITMPKVVGQIPIYYNHRNTGRPAHNIVLMKDFPINAPQFSMGSSSYYIDAGSEPMFPFGYGLSYTTFEYGDPCLSTTEITMNGTLTVTCEIKNTGKYDAYETAQLYTRDLVASVCQPVRELRDFQKIWIPAGKSVTVQFTLKADQLAFCHNDLTTYAEPGEFMLWIAPDSRQGKAVKFELK